MSVESSMSDRGTWLRTEDVAPGDTGGRVAIVTPALADANNGNWRTAQRWAGLLKRHYQVTVGNEWTASMDAVLLALHARRSHRSIVAYAASHPDRRLVVALTGTDLYSDLPAKDPHTLESLALASRLIVLQDDAVAYVPAEHRKKVQVVVQSCAAQENTAPHDAPLQVVVVGHLRQEKDPETLWRAVETLPPAVAIDIVHVGKALAPGMGERATALMMRDSRYRWLGGLAHEETRALIAGSHLLVHPSRMEGGANVISEAAVSGTAVLASCMSGNIGLLGRDYPGYFPVGDAAALAYWLQTLAHDRSALVAWCAALAPVARRMTTEAEQASLLQVLQ
jgi:putative glycosyltransferase (TIGR04348 family)